MELFETIRREYRFGVGTIKGVAKKLGIHRRMVREALADAVPERRKKIERARPKLEPVSVVVVPALPRHSHSHCPWHSSEQHAPQPVVRRMPAPSGAPIHPDARHPVPTSVGRADQRRPVRL